MSLLYVALVRRESPSLEHSVTEPRLPEDGNDWGHFGIFLPWSFITDFVLVT